MTDYVKVSVGLTVSESSDYSSPHVGPIALLDELSGDLEVLPFFIEAHTTAVSVDLSMFTTIHYVILDNRNSAVDVVAQFTTAGGHVGSGAATNHDIAAGRLAVFTDVTAASDIAFDSESSTTHRVWGWVIGT